ncbi:hypothetical protein ALC56_03268 [Trachymyrmex septentrionalis]|uniref:Uncharacterized protein n=1 Tax=Trachymyrmex septentrionalis TaxID=34720 RepID=A0A195FNJ6_9HYME|nr:hypothetical protein ALC56_03268 [Trachymyrmex septentrionalis]
MFHFKKNKRGHATHEGRDRVFHLKEGCGETRSTFHERNRFTEIIEYLRTNLAPVIEHILLNASLFAFCSRAILAKSKSIIDTIWISGLSYASDVQMNLVILVSDNDHDSSG